MEALERENTEESYGTFKILDDESNALIYVFGQNSYGELGIGDLEEKHVPTKLSFFNNIEISQIAAGNEHTAVLTKAGEVYTFGFNGSGQLGHGNTKSYHHPKLVEALVDHKIEFIASANGCEHLASVNTKGELFMCGYNNYGQLGNGSQVNETIPSMLPGFKEKSVFFVAWSYYHTIIIVNESENRAPLKDITKTSVYAVGRNDSGQLGLEHNNHEFYPKLIAPMFNKEVVKAACGLHHSVFLTRDGHIYSSGFNDNGQLGLGDKNHRNSPIIVNALENEKIVDVACGYYHTLARTDKGDIYSFGRNDKGQWGIEEIGSSYLFPIKIYEFEVPNSLANLFISAADQFKSSSVKIGISNAPYLTANNSQSSSQIFASSCK